MSTRWLEERIASVGQRFRAGVEGLSDADFDAHPIAGKWSLGEYVHHITEVDLGWTDLFYQAIAPDESIARPYVKDWNAAAIARSKASIAAALDVFDQNHRDVGALLATLPDAALVLLRPGVSWLKTNNIQFQINDNCNWGLVMHVDHSLRCMHKHRVALEKPLAWMENVPLQHPPASGRARDGGDVD